jgi:hypothetical protein
MEYEYGVAMDTAMESLSWHLSVKEILQLATSILVTTVVTLDCAYFYCSNIFLWFA